MFEEVPVLLRNMSPQQRWEWFEKQCDAIREGGDSGQGVKFSNYVAQAFSYMQGLNQFKYCESQAILHNMAVRVMCSIIEQNDAKSADWLYSLVEMCGDPTYQMYTDPQKFFDARYLPLPESVKEYRESLKRVQQHEEQDKARYQDWYKKNVVPRLKTKNEEI